MLEGILEVYRCLLFCKTMNKRPKLFCKAVKILWKKLNFKDDVLKIEADESLAEDDHAYLLKIIEKLGSENNERIKDKIKEIFEHENTSFTIDNQKLVISSYKIILSNIWEELINKIKTNDFEITSVEIVANEIILDQNFVLSGKKNLTLIANNLLIPFPVVINLSGKNAIDNYTSAAESGKLFGENGKEGKDGIVGESAGNCTILTKTIFDTANLEILLNGGNGSNGQDGGDGANGEDGKGADFDVIGKHKVKIVLKNVANVFTGGIFSRTLDKESETIASDGSVIFSNDSAYYFSTQSYRLYIGSEGKPGGNGGKNGLGGKGGEGGDFNLTVDNCVTKDVVKVQSFKGEDGRNGKVGENGQPGLKGWDIAITGKTLEKGKIYGQSKKEKLRIEYFKTKDTDTVYVSDRNNAENDFKCYARILPEPLQRSKLINHSNEKTSEKAENERKSESIARKVSPIDEEKAKEKYEELTQSILTAELEKQLEAEAEYEETTEINRLYEIYNFEFEEEYQPKKKHDTRTITAEEVDKIQKTKEGWGILWKYPSPSCFSFEKKLRNKVPNDEIKTLLIKKTLIDNLRDADSDEDDESLTKTRTQIIEKFKANFDENSIYANILNDSSNLITTEEEPINTKLKRLLTFIEKDDQKYLCKKLTLLYLKSEEIGLTLINTLLLIFECEGKHIDLETLNFLIETVFTITNSTDEEFLFPSILLSKKQSNWIDEIFMLIVEHAFSLSPKMKKWLKELLPIFVDENLKILFCEKLLNGDSENTILKDQLYFLLDPIKDSASIYPDLENVPLKDWINVIDNNILQHVTESSNIVFRDPETKKLTMFCSDKLIEKFGQVTIRPLFELIARLVASLDKDVIGRFFQRLCNNEIISGNVNCNNLEDILKCSLTIHGTSKNETEKDGESYKIAKELLSSAKKELRKTEDLQSLCQKLNKSNQLSNIINSLKQPFEWMIQEKIEECYKKLKSKDFSYDFSLEAFEAFLMETYADLNNSEMKHSLFLLEIIDKIIINQCGFCLRDTQKLAILCALNNKDAENRMKSILQQISTGEGKTLIIAALSIILVLKSAKKLKVNIVTSSSVLAKREIESSNGCLALYEAFNIKAGHICHDSLKKRIKIYSDCDVIYGDLTVYQSDYLQDNYLSKNILGDRGMNVVIVDEVDSMLLDNGLNMLYLSHEIAELELLQPVFTKIWQMINLRFSQNIDFGALKDEEFYQSIYSTFFPSLSWNDFAESLDVTESEADSLKKMLISKKIADENGRILVTNKKYLNHKLWNIQNISPNVKNKFLCFYNTIMKETHIKVPSNLHNYLINHLKDFIESAEAAYEMKEGINYQIETISNLHSENLESRIVIIDSDTGVDLPTTQWTKGLHQFLQLKHGLRLTPVSTKAVYISNVSYLKKYDCIFGFSGTLGAEAEKEELIEFYDLKCITIPPSFPKQFYEEPAILTNSDESYIMEIFNTLNNLMKSGRSALVIADSIKLATILNQRIMQIAKQQPEHHQLQSFLKATVYKRDFEKLEYADGTTPLPPKTIIFSTNLAGRGTDIKISEALEANGGLHVIVAFLPPNIRIEEQAFGRAARCGEPGTAQMIIFKKDEKSFLELKSQRNKKENERIQKIKKHYHSKIEPEEKCFLNFSVVLKHLKRQIQQKNLPSECYEILCKDIIDQYALELDASMFGENWMEKMEEFCDSLKIKYPMNDENVLLPLQPSNKLRYAIKMAYDKKIDEANIIFDKLGFYYPEYLPESKYFSAIYAIKKRDKPELLDSLESILNEAKNGFYERLKLYTANVSMIDPFRISDDEGMFYNDDFQQQQQHCEHLTLSIIESIDEFLGQIIEPMNFICDSLKEESAMLVYENLKNYENPPITGFKVCKDFDEEKLEEYCQEKSVNFNSVKTDLKKGKIISEKHLRGLFEIQSYQDFWQALKAAYLLDKTSTETFIDITKLSQMSEEVLLGCIIGEYKFEENHLIQYPEVKEWKRLSNTRDIHDLRRCFEDNNVIKTTEFAYLSYKDRPFEATLLLSPWIGKDDICAYGISEENSQKLLSSMENDEILKKHKKDDFYKLSPNFTWEKCQNFPKWCKQILIKMLKKKFAYVFAYQHFITNGTHDCYKQLPDENDKTFINELMEIGILESNNINLNALNSPVPNGNIFDKGCGFVLDSNPSQHYYRALSATQTSIKKTFTKPQHHKSIVSKSSKEQIENVLKEKASARQKYENLDIQFVPIQDLLNDLNIDGIRVKPVTHSLPYLINPCERKWSKKTLVTLGMVGSGAAVQLAAGVSLVIITFGLGAFAGKFLITEGLSDAIFCAKTLWKGKSDNFFRYKTASMALNVALCGITEPLKYVKVIPSILNTDAVNVIRRADIFISSGGSVLKTLIPNLTKIEKCETTKNFISHAIKFTIQEVDARFMLILGEIFQNTIILKTNMIQFFRKIGIKNGEKVVEGQFEIIKRDVEPIIINLFSFVVTEVNKKCIKNSTINLANYSVIIGAIMQSQKFENFMNLIKQSITNSILNISTFIKQKNDESAFEVGIEDSEAAMNQSISKIIVTWKIELEQKYKRLIEIKIQRPLSELNNMDYQNQLREIVSDTSPRTLASQQKTPTQINLTNHEKFVKKIKTEYYLQLERILETTKDSDAFARLTLTTARNHQICVNSLAKLISSNLQRPITLIIKYGNINLNGRAGDVSDGNNLTQITLQQPHEDDNSIANLYDQIILKFPGLGFPDFGSFKNALAQVIQNDSDFQQR
uniref:Chloroplast protein-transporting ATPase n=1 Tax=Panagrolaimus davidi TaxID=227884 RepID=A0A914QLI7_9BILA